MTPGFPHRAGEPPGIPGLELSLAGRMLREGMLEGDLSLKEAAGRIARSIGTVKRALKGSMGPRTAYRIMKEFGSRGG